MATVHVSPYGGSWYPGDRDELGCLLDDLFEHSIGRNGKHLIANPLGFVVPHAGLQYSGTVAAAAYRHLHKTSPQRVVILGFAHRGGPSGVAMPDLDGYQTPLGEIRTDRETMTNLAARKPFQMAAERVCDHSVEIQLPLIQWAAPQARVVPLFVGRLDAHERDEAAQALAALHEPGTVFLVSSDLTHYGKSFGYEPFPVDSAISERLRGLDRCIMEAAGSLDGELFREALQEKRSTACGVAPITLWARVLSFIGGEEIFQETLDYDTSGNITGDYQHTVSYGALGYFPASSFCVGERERELLLDSAQETLRRLRATQAPVAVGPKEITDGLGLRAGVFVSLHQGEQLLGCVGNRASDRSLAENVAETTLSAALGDPRFPTVMGVEGPIDIEISILSPFKRIRDARRFRIGEHGALLESTGCAGLLLPQVARGREWDSEQFMRALSVKAGLGTKGYLSPGARLSVFRAQVFAAARGSQESCAFGHG